MELTRSDDARMAAIYGQVIADAEDAVLLLDPTTLTILDANAAFAEMVGVSRQECRQRTLFDFDDHPPAELNEVVRLLGEKRSVNLPRWRFCGDAECFYAHTILTRTPDPDGFALAILHRVSPSAARVSANTPPPPDYGDLRSDISKALSRDSFQLAFQPIMTYEGSPRAIGAEALLRWDHPEFGLIPPNDFIQHAEASGRMPELDRWVTRGAVQQLATWRKTYPELEMNINISAQSFSDPAFPVWLRSAIDDAGVPAESLTLELSGACLEAPVDTVIEGIGLIREMGVRVALDDFGLVSHELVNDLRVDVVKLDRSFIIAVGRTEAEKRAVSALCDMLEDATVTVMAVGVETQEQLDYLLSLEIVLLQGYYFQRPVPAANLSSYFYFAASR